MRAELKLQRNGNSTTITIPRAILHHLGWIAGERIILELLEDNSLRARRPKPEDFAPIAAPRLVYTQATAEAK